GPAGGAISSATRDPVSGSGSRDSARRRITPTDAAPQRRSPHICCATSASRRSWMSSRSSTASPTRLPRSSPRCGRSDAQPPKRTRSPCPSSSAAPTRARSLSKMSTRQVLELINDEDATVAAAVRAAIPQIERAVDLIVPALASGHRLFYVGAGTSGRLGVLDASEMPPTFGVEPELVTGIIAGGDHALRMSVEGAEDAPLGLRDLAARATAGDVVVGISASGRAPYVVDA